MRVVLGTFARSGIEASLGCDIATGVEAALRHYIRHPEPDAWLALLRFCHQHPPTRSGDDLELSIDPETEGALQREARESHGVSVEQLARHAVLVFLADLDEAEASGFAAGPLARLRGSLS